MSKFFGFLISFILIGLGIGGLFYLSHPKDYSDSVLEDISPESGFEWDKIKEGMYVKLEVNNQAGYYTYKKDDNGEDLIRIYLVYNYNQKTNTYSRLIGVMVDSKRFDEWDSLENNKLTADKYLKKITIKNHVYKIPSTVLKSIKSSLVFDREDKADEIERMLVPYYIGPEVMQEDIVIYKSAAWISVAVGCVLLLICIIGIFINRD